MFKVAQRDCARRAGACFVPRPLDEIADRSRASTSASCWVSWTVRRTLWGAYDEVVARFGEAPEPALRERVAGALVNKGVTLGALDRSEEALGVY